jgi:hypothetical protein
MKTKIILLLAIAIASLLILSQPAQAGYMVTLQQVGSNVVATGIGPIDLTGLSSQGSGIDSARMVPMAPTILTGPTGSDSEDFYTGLTGPTSFGSGADTNASSGSGNFVGISIAPPGFGLTVPHGYVSGSPLSDSSTYNNATFSSLGVTPGIYEWTWGTGANQNFTLDAVAPAVPDSGSTLGLLSLSVVALLGATRLRFPSQLAA